MRNVIVWGLPSVVGLGVIIVAGVARGQDAGDTDVDTDVAEVVAQDPPEPPPCPAGSQRLDDACIVLPTFVAIEGGTAVVGSPDDAPHRTKDEVQREVEVEAFEISAHEITQGQFRLLVGDNPSQACGQRVDANAPVACVSWNDAIRFCNAMSEASGKTAVYTLEGGKVAWNREADGYRLPTEVEWEHAARRPSGATLAGGDLPEAVAWYRENAAGRAHRVGGLRPTESGVYDLSGNVSEWVWDGWVKDPTKADEAEIEAGPLRVQKGGSFLDTPGLLRVAARDYDRADTTALNVGFRVVRPASGAGPTESESE